ncbi:hypothetical protein C2I36_11300 [Rhodobacteraceae bacterium WD3A24]|nr:hypothetical protein C2I36_11300 [Rhodobacteraceae bacterium WD3A24]
MAAFCAGLVPVMALGAGGGAKMGDTPVEDAETTQSETAAEGDAAQGETLYEESCAECHSSPSRIMRRVEGEDDAARAQALEGFLADHHAPEAQDRRDIIAYLLDL